jgi:hypothetical protein
VSVAVSRDETLTAVRKLCLSLPETSERPSHGAPTFFVRGKRAFLMVLTNHHGDGRFAIWCAAPDGMQAMLVEADPDRFFVPPYVGHRGWLGMRLDRGLDLDELAGTPTRRSRRRSWSRPRGSRATRAASRRITGGRKPASVGRPAGKGRLGSRNLAKAGAKAERQEVDPGRTPAFRAFR